ncbi:MAG: carbohydrate-binding domain-containing protein, partial [Acetanaerobacterium sp.]
MNRLKGHLRLFAVVTALIVFAAAGAPAVFADTTSLDFSSGDIVIDADGDYSITGSTTDHTITVSAGVTATITLEDVDIDASATEDACAFSIESGADITLILTGENSLKSGENCAGLQVPDGASLTIEGDGSLTAEGGYNGAGIGGYAGGKG